ncbi:hypothetical protein [Microbacterium sp. 1P10AE]|uniref:hypothetical protein n=1 Tax=Microbacterium sp. 1P10AE TaxID=3132286 RepID=UPI0039A3E643
MSAGLYARALQLADKALNEPTLVAPTTNEGMLAAARTVRDRVYPLLLVWKATGQEKYIQRAWRDLAVATQLPSWRPEHFLGTAEMMASLAVAYDWGSGYWSASQKQQLVAALVEKGVGPALSVLRAPAAPGSAKDWRALATNVNVVINSALIMTAIALNGDATAPVDELLDAATDSLAVGLTSYAADGSVVEGPTYWVYATRYLVSAALSRRQWDGQEPLGRVDQEVSFLGGQVLNGDATGDL